MQDFQKSPAWLRKFIRAMKIKKGDKIKIIAGKDTGREGIVERAYKKAGVVIVPGINLYKRHIKKNEKMPQGGVVEIPRAINVSKIMLICPKCSKTTRVSYEIKRNKKSRICRKCKSEI